jgi:hypothetical protein
MESKNVIRAARLHKPLHSMSKWGIRRINSPGRALDWRLIEHRFWIGEVGADA